MEDGRETEAGNVARANLINLLVLLPTSQESKNDLSPQSHLVARGGGGEGRQGHLLVGGEGVCAGGGGGGWFPGRPEPGLAVPTGAPAADGPRPLCPWSSAATRSNVTAGPRAGVRGVDLDLNYPHLQAGPRGGGGVHGQWSYWAGGRAAAWGWTYSRVWDLQQIF